MFRNSPYVQVLSIELRKILAYRFDFWSNFIGIIFIELAVAYFLWGAIYSVRGVTTMQGYSFEALMFYYLLVPVLTHITQAQAMHFISDDIYQGSLTRYLIYPISFLGYKLTAHLAFSLVSILQFAVALGVFYFFFGFPESVVVNAMSVGLCLGAAVLGAVLYFFMAACLEMVAFWADNVWSLMVMLKFAIRFLGGAAIPIAFFPEWSWHWIRMMPFYSIMGLPVEIMLNRLSTREIAIGFARSLIWIFVAYGISLLIWNRGKYKFSGVGI